MPYEYHAKVINVVDGDTIVVDIDLGFNVVLSNQSVRLLGVEPQKIAPVIKLKRYLD